MSYNVAYKKQQEGWKNKFPGIMPCGRDWWVLLDFCGKVRDWVAAWDSIHARSLFKNLRDYGRIPKGYTVERRGPVTRENW